MGRVVEIGYLQQLEDDVKFCLANHSKGDDKQFWRRSIVRSFFGYIEALTYAARQYFLIDRFRIVRSQLLSSDQKRHDRVVSIFAATEPLEFDLKENGQANVRSRRIRTLPFIKSVIRLKCDLFDNDELAADTLFKSKAWKAFESVLGVRDRLMHPKIHEDVIVSDAEYKDFLHANYLVLSIVAGALKIGLETPSLSNNDSESTYGLP